MSRTKLLLVLIAITLASTSVQAQDIFSAFRTLTPGSGFDATNKKLSVGRIEFELATGTLWPVNNADGLTLGYVFEGKGHYTYRVEDPSDLETLVGNLGDQAPNLGHSASSVYDDFGRAMILVTKPFAAELLGEAKAGPISGSANSWYQDRYTKCERDGWGFSHLAAESALNGEPLLSAYAELDGQRADLGYYLDDTRTSREGLWAFVQPPGRQYRIPRVISIQRTSTAERKQIAPYLTRHIAWDVNTPDNKRGTISSTLTLKFQKAGRRILGFRLASNRDSNDSANWTSTVNQLLVTSVTDGSGKPLAYSHRYNELMIDLGTAPLVGSEVKLTVASDANVFTAMNDERGQNYVMLYMFPWYPQALGWSGERFTFELTARCKKPFYPVSSGETVSLKEENGMSVLVAKTDTPIDDFSLFMGKYTPYSMTSERGVKIQVHGYGLVNEKGLEEIANVSSVFLRMFEDQLGVYPFKELDIVEIPGYSPYAIYGISPASLVMLGDAGTRTVDSASKNIGTRVLPGLIAHELAHQWFGHKIWQASELDNWITESFSEYQSGIGAQYAKLDDQVARGQHVKGWRAMLDDWRSFGKWCDKDTSIEAANRLRDANAGAIRRCLLYNRGPLVLHMFRNWMSDKAYFAVIQQLIKNNEYGPVTSDDFAKAASQVLNTNLQWFVDDWIRTGGTPEISVEATTTTSSDGKLALLCKTTQADVKNAKRLYIPIVLTYSDGRKEAKMCFVSGATSSQTIPLVATPAKIEVDPEKTALVKYK